MPEGETESGLFRWDPGGRSAGRQGVYRHQRVQARQLRGGRHPASLESPGHRGGVQRSPLSPSGLALPPLFPSSCPRHPPPPTTSTSLKHSLSGITLSAVFISWEGCNKSPQMGELQQKSPPSDSGGQSLKPGGSQGRAPSRGSKGGFYLSLPALGGSRYPWLVATSLPSLPPS